TDADDQRAARDDRPGRDPALLEPGDDDVVDDPADGDARRDGAEREHERAGDGDHEQRAVDVDQLEHEREVSATASEASFRYRGVHEWRFYPAAPATAW